MRSLACLVFVILIYSSNVYSQREIDGSMFSSVWEMYSNNYLNSVNSGKGNTGIASENGIGGIKINPASFSQKNIVDLNVQYTVKTIQPWDIYGFNSDIEFRQNWYFSGSVGLGFKINKNLNAGIVYSNPNNFLLYEGTATITPQIGASSTFDQYGRIHVHQISLPVSYSIGKFKIGINLTYGWYINQYHGIISTIQNPDGYEGDSYERYSRFNAQVGAIYKAGENLSLGATLTPGYKATLTEDNNSYTPADNNIIFVDKSPLRAGIGFEYRFPKSDINISGDFKYENTSVSDGYKDRYNLNFGAEFLLNKKFTLRTGFFTLTDNRQNTGYTSWGVSFGQYQQYFLTLGGTMNFKNSDLTAALLDSHISPGIVKNTYLNLSYNYHF